LAGDCKNFLQRTADVFWAAMICIYCVSAAPALLILKVPTYDGRGWQLLVFLLIIAELNDVCQYLWGNVFGKHRLAPKVSPNKTWEGFLGGVATVTLIGFSLTWLTPFTHLQTAGFAALIALCGTAGGLVMSAIKRDAGVKDYGSLIAGHGGVMDRIDSLTFAAPVFFHIVRYYFSAV
jgi:phosphatidate cytidylyltransferase